MNIRKTDIILDGFSCNPKCVHGPTVLFKDTVNGKERLFYACAAYRDKKICDFHAAKDEKFTQGKIFKWKLKQDEFMEGRDHFTCYQPMKEFELSGEEKGRFCETCGKIVGKDTLDQLHKNHQVKQIFSNQLGNPLSILQAKTLSKKEAQFFFNKESSRYLQECIRTVGSSHILCIGAPSIFQSLPSNFNKLLLDIDHRYLGFYSPSQFIWFNMMNFHFFNDNQTNLEKFLTKAANVSIVLDPPFGGRPELIQYSLDRIRQLVGPDVTLSIFWIYPYFQEKQLQSVIGDLKMTNYRVNYTNHKGFSGSEQGRKYGSPIRIFTNVPLR